MAHDSPRIPESAAQPLAVLVRATDPGSEQTPLWGLSVRDRLVAGLAHAGARVVDPAGPAEARALYLRTDHVYDERVLQRLLHAERDLLLCSDDAPAAASAPPERASQALEALRGGPRDGFEPVRPADLAPSFDPALRRHSTPYALRVDPERARAVENHLFRAAYKTVTDAVTKWAWPLPARAVTRWCVQRGVQPNTVTALSYLLTAAVTALWAFGFFGLGLVLAWCMTFLDTVDGKLARVTLTSSRLGQVLDHGLDLVHPPIWWAAWAGGLAGDPPSWGEHAAAAWVVVGGYVIGRLLEGVFLLTFRMEMFIWRPFDGWFRLIIARRNPNLVLLTGAVLATTPEAGLLAVAAWTIASTGIQAVRIGQALEVRRSGGRVESWFDEPPTPTL